MKQYANKALFLKSALFLVLLLIPGTSHLSLMQNQSTFLPIETLEKSLDAAYSVTNNNVLGTIKRNIAWFSLVKGDCNKTIDHVQQALLYDNTKCECYYYLMYSYSQVIIIFMRKNVNKILIKS